MSDPLRVAGIGVGHLGKHHARLLAQIDGSVNFEELFALSGLPRLDAAKILAQLLADGVIRGGAQ